MKPAFHLYKRLCGCLLLIWTCGVAWVASASEAGNAEDSLQSLTDAVTSVRTNAFGDLAFLLNLLKASDPREEAVLQDGFVINLTSRQVGPYVLLTRQHGIIHGLRAWASDAASGPLVPVLIDSLESEDLVLASSAAAALGVMGRNASSALPALMEAARSQRLPVSRNAIAAPGDVSSSSIEVVALLMRTLNESRDIITRENAVMSLGKQGEMAVEASATLRGLLHEPDRISMHAARALASVAPDDPETLKAFEGMLESESWPIRRFGVLGLGCLGRDESVIKLLEAATKDKRLSPGVRELATSILSLHEGR